MDKHKKLDYNMNDKKKSEHPDILPEKYYTSRNSLLTDMFQNLHFRVIYRIGIAIIFSIILNNGISYYKFGSINVGQRLYQGFEKLHIASLIWLYLFISSLLTYLGFNIWVMIRNELNSKDDKIKIFNAFSIGSILVYYTSILIYIPAFLVVKLDLPALSSVIVIIEQIRFLMKVHAFLRTNIPKVHCTNQENLPKFHQFVYFLFAPTLVYQNSYPRTEKVNWKYVTTCFIEVLGCIFLMSLLIDKIITNFDHVCTKKITWFDIAEVIFSHALHGTAIAFLCNYLLLHCWQNAFAEMLRFADRLFYKDWWTSSSYPRHYRTWNVVVHDWLYTYVYKDFYEIITPKNKVIAKLMVTLLSALFHEYFIAIALRFCLPVLFFQFFILGSIVSVIKETKHGIANMLLLYTFGLGMSWQISIYSLEYMARLRNNEEDFNYLLGIPSIIRNNCVT